MKRRKQLIANLMRHRKDDVVEFAESLNEILMTRLDDSDERQCEKLLQTLRDDLDDIDCAILDVFLATKLEDAESIVDGFYAEK